MTPMAFKTMIPLDFRLLLRYSLKNKKRRNKEKVRSGPLASAFSSWFGYLLAPLIFVVFLTPVYYDLFLKLAVPLVKFGMNSPFLVSDVLLAPVFTVTGLLFSLQFAALLVVELFENDMTPLLLTMPIRRSSIFIVSSMNTLLMTNFGISMTVSISLAYSMLNRDRLWWAILGICLWMLFLIALGVLFGLLLAKLIGKTAAKRASQLITFLIVILVVISPSVVTPVNGLNPGSVLRSLSGSANLFLSSGWPHYWLMVALKGQLAFLILLLAVTVSLFTFVFVCANTLNYSPARKNRDRRRVEVVGEKSGAKNRGSFPLLKKELRLMFRESGIIWYLIYPLAFPILLVIGRYHQTPFVSLLFMIVATMYSGMVSVTMMVFEKRIWPVPTYFPVSFLSSIRLKVFIPVVLFVLESLILLGLFIAQTPSAIYDVFMIAPIAMILYYCSLLGIRLFLQDPDRDISQRNRLLKGSEVLRLEAVSIGFSVGFYGAFYCLKTFLIEGSFLFFERLPPWSVILLLAGILIALLALLLRSIQMERRKIHRLLVE